VAELITGLDADRLRANLAEVRDEIAAAARRAGRVPDDVEVIAAGKYVAPGELPVLAAAGIEAIGENRAQDLAAKVAIHGDLFAWHFIGALQSRKVRQILPHVTLIHSLASESALEQLVRHAADARPGLEVLLEVDLAGEESKSGLRPGEIGSFVERSPVPVTGLMAMPPLAADPEDSRRWFATLRELAESNDLQRLSMGTTQDFVVAVEEGATIVRIGTRMYR